MNEGTAKDARTRREAARWFARLSRLSVTTDALREFRAWRGQPGNAEAYTHVEAAWRASGRLAGDAEIRRLTEAALEARPPKPRHRRARAAVPGSATAAVLAAVVGGGWYVTEAGRAYATGVGEQRLLVLDDGSRVHLNTDSRIRVRFHRAERDVDLLRGEAFFEVAHDPERPFIVAADGARVRALGTRFDVRRDDDRVEITLVEGKVRVTRNQRAQATTLAPQQQVTADAAGISPPAPADLEAATAWTTGRLIFRATPLWTAVAEVNRYSATKIELDAPASLKTRRVSGVFDTGDTPAFVAAVRTLFKLDARAVDGTIRLTPVAARASG